MTRINFVPQFIVQISITVFFQIYFSLHRGGLLSTSHINFSTPSTINIAAWRKTQGLSTLQQLPSNCLVASAQGQTETLASCRHQQHFSCLENGSGRNRLQLFFCRNRKVASARAHV